MEPRLLFTAEETEAQSGLRKRASGSHTWNCRYRPARCPAPEHSVAVAPGSVPCSSPAPAEGTRPARPSPKPRMWLGPRGSAPSSAASRCPRSGLSSVRTARISEDPHTTKRSSGAPKMNRWHPERPFCSGGGGGGAQKPVHVTGWPEGSPGSPDAEGHRGLMFGRRIVVPWAHHPECPSWEACPRPQQVVAAPFCF